MVQLNLYVIIKKSVKKKIRRSVSIVRPVYNVAVVNYFDFLKATERERDREIIFFNIFGTQLHFCNKAPMSSSSATNKNAYQKMTEVFIFISALSNELNKNKAPSFTYLWKICRKSAKLDFGKKDKFIATQ